MHIGDCLNVAEHGSQEPSSCCKPPASPPHFCSRDGAQGKPPVHWDPLYQGGQLRLNWCQGANKHTTLPPTLQRRSAAASAAQQPPAAEGDNHKGDGAKPAKRQRKGGGGGGSAAAAAAAEQAGEQQFFLMKSEPDVFGIDDLAARPGQTEPWDGA